MEGTTTRQDKKQFEEKRRNRTEGGVQRNQENQQENQPTTKENAFDSVRKIISMHNRFLKKNRNKIKMKTLLSDAFYAWHLFTHLTFFY